MKMYVEGKVTKQKAENWFVHSSHEEAFQTAAGEGNIASLPSHLIAETAGQREQAKPEKKEQSSLSEKLKRIKECEVIFVWLNEKNMQTAFSEIGAAYALKKPIYLGIDEAVEPGLLFRHNRFFQVVANQTVYAKTAEEAVHQLVQQAEKEEKPLFWYVDTQRELSWLHCMITNFCDKLVQEYSVMELNEMDRDRLVRRFQFAYRLSERFDYQIKETSMLTDIAHEIDRKIVQRFLWHKSQQAATKPTSYSIKGTGLRYFFAENYTWEQESLRKGQLNESLFEGIVEYFDPQIGSNLPKNADDRNEESEAERNCSVVYEEKETESPSSAAEEKTADTFFENRISDLQSNFIQWLLLEKQMRVTVPIKSLTTTEAEFIIDHLYNHLSLPETESYLLVSTQVPVYKATEILQRLKERFPNAESGLFTVHFHTKCLYYFEDKGIVTEKDNEYVTYTYSGADTSRRVSRHYTDKWFELLEDTLSNEEKFGILKDYRRKKKEELQLPFLTIK